MAGRSPRAPYKPPHGCRCGVRWAGYQACHCAACHLTFTAIRAFDKHRGGNKHGEKPGECSDPPNVGLVLKENQQWGYPDTDNRWEK
jgi:hypothetical protein